LAELRIKFFMFMRPHRQCLAGNIIQSG
jgi:hypothetical protein